MDAMMKMDNAAFTKQYEEVMARAQKWETPNRPHEKQMVEAAKYVREMSEKDFRDYANGIITGNRQHMGRSERQSPENKASLIAENAALRYRVFGMVAKQDPALAALAAENPAALANQLRDDKDGRNWKRWLLLLPLALLLAYCTTKDRDPNTLIAPPGPGDLANPGAAADYCEKCANGQKSQLNKTRKSEVNTSLVMTDAIRLSLTQRWMKTKEWKNAVDLFKQNRTAVVSKNANTQSVANALEKVITDSSVANVQDLQRCIGMAAKDDMRSQDGILGEFTTGKLVAVITGCIRKVDGPAPVPAPVPAPAWWDPDIVSRLPESGSPI